MNNLSSIKDLFASKPREINATEFVQQRAAEIARLMSVTYNEDLPRGEVAQGPRTCLQRLPRHMRRRAMAHNAKRAPLRMRNDTIRGQSDRRPRRRPPTRHFKRRRHNLSRYFGARKGSSHWLATHLWHVKRFRMRDYYGYKVAEESYQRSFRASYRDALRHCVVHDESYLSIFEVQGEKSWIIDNLYTLCDPKIGLTFKSPIFQTGKLSGQVVLYNPEKFPYGCIGPVQYFWVTVASIDNSITVEKLILRVHPVIKDELKNIFVKLFSLEEKICDEKLGNNRQHVTIFHDKNESVKFTIFEQVFAQFKLIGPKSTAILNNVLKKPSVEKCSQSESSWNVWKSYSNLQPGSLQCGTIVNLTVDDPRLYTDYKKTLPDKYIDCKVVPMTSSIDVVNPSELFNGKVYNPTKKTHEAILNKQRSECRKAGLDFNAESMDTVAVTVIQNPGLVSAGLGQGWTLIVPDNWAKEFWLALQYRTARAAGLKFGRHFGVECKVYNFPDEWPDTVAGTVAELANKKELMEKFMKKPPNRRISFHKLNVKYPFKCPWLEMINGWSEKLQEKYFIMRDRQVLNQLKLVLNGKCKVQSIEWKDDALIGIRIESFGKGNPKRFAMLCIPDENDIEKILNLNLFEESIKSSSKTIKLDSYNNKNIPENSKDEFLSLNSTENRRELNLHDLFIDRQEMKCQNRKMNKKLKKKQRREKQQNNKSEILLKNNEMESIEKNVVDFSSRKIVGFVTNGDFSFFSGRGGGVACCSMTALKNFLGKIPLVKFRNRNFRPLLFRNSSSQCYRVCSFDIAQF